MRLEQLVSDDGHKPITWREVPVEETAAGTMGHEAAPRILQLLIGRGDDVSDQDEFERRLFLTRRRAEIEFGYAVSFPSFSSRTIVYKGMLTAPQLPEFYPDLTDSELQSRVRDRPLALLDEHAAELGAGPAAATDRPQR